MEVVQEFRILAQKWFKKARWSLQAILMCLVGELAGGRFVAVAVSTSDLWQVTGDKWQVTCDTWHMTHFYIVTVFLSADVNILSVSCMVKKKSFDFLISYQWFIIIYCFYKTKYVTISVIYKQTECPSCVCWRIFRGTNWFLWICGYVIYVYSLVMKTTLFSWTLFFLLL